MRCWKFVKVENLSKAFSKRCKNFLQQRYKSSFLIHEFDSYLGKNASPHSHSSLPIFFGIWIIVLLACLIRVSKTLEAATFSRRLLHFLWFCLFGRFETCRRFNFLLLDALGNLTYYCWIRGDILREKGSFLWLLFYIFSLLSYVYQSAKFDTKFFYFFARLFILFYRSPMYETFRTENKINNKFRKSVYVAFKMKKKNF